MGNGDIMLLHYGQWGCYVETSVALTLETSLMSSDFLSERSITVSSCHQQVVFVCVCVVYYSRMYDVPRHGAKETSGHDTCTNSRDLIASYCWQD